MSLSRSLSVLMPALSIVFTGITNLLMPLTFQLIGGVDGLGIYTLVAIPYTVALAIQRMVVSQSLSRGMLPRDVDHLWWVCGGAAATCVVVSAGTALILTDAVWPLVLAAMIPFALFQDMLRYVFLGQKRADIATMSDGIWLAAAGILFSYAVIHGKALSPLAASLLLLLGCLLSLGAEIVAFRIIQLQGRELATPNMMPLLSESTIVFGAGQVTQYVVAGFAGAAVIGEYKAVLLLMTPLTMFVNLAQAVLLPRLDFGDSSRVVRAGVWLGLCVGSVGTISVVAGYFNPFKILSALGFATGGVVVTTGAILVVAASLSAFLGVYLVRFRVTRPSSLWVRIRVLSALTDPVVSIPMALWIGLPGIATGTLSSNSSALALIGLARSSAHRGRHRITVWSG